MDTSEEENAILSDLEKLQNYKVVTSANISIDVGGFEDIAAEEDNDPQQGPSSLHTQQVDISGDLEVDALRALEAAREDVNLAEEHPEVSEPQVHEEKVFAPGSFPFGELEFSDTSGSVYEPIGKSHF